MPLGEERRASLLAYCKLTELADDPEVTALIPVLYDAAVGYMTNAGVSQPAAGTRREKQYDLCVDYLVLSAYEQRDVAAPSMTDSRIFRWLINQLKLTEPGVGM